MTYCQLQRVNTVLPQYCYVRSQRIKQTRQLVILRVIQISKYFQRGFTFMDNRIDQYSENIVMSSLGQQGSYISKSRACLSVNRSCREDRVDPLLSPIGTSLLR